MTARWSYQGLTAVNEIPDMLHIETPNINTLKGISYSRMKALKAKSPKPAARPSKILMPHVNARMNDSVHVIGFLDTGSSVSAVSSETAMFLDPIELKTPITMRSAQGTFNVTEEVYAVIDLGLSPKAHRFYVIPTLTKGVLLGNDFMAPAGISLWPGENSFVQDGARVPYIERNDNKTTMDLHLVEHVNYIRENYKVDAEIEDRFYKLLDEFSEIFDCKPAVAKVAPMRINTGDAAPVKQRVRPVNPAKTAIAAAYTQEQIDLGIMSPANGPWASNYVFVGKPDGSLRPCGDFRGVNSKTVFDAYGMPNVKDILYRIARAKIFSTFDLSKGFNQIPVHHDDRNKTAIFTPLGLMQFNVMPFGLKNAPAVFQRVMEDVLGDMLHKTAMVYIDDIIIFSETEEEHLQHLRTFYERMKEFNFRINPKKLQPLQKKIKILGHIVQNGRYEPDPEKIEGIQDCPIPETRKQLRSFLGSVSYYRQFVAGLAKVAEPLYAMTSTKITTEKVVEWTPMALQAFAKLKTMMIGLVLHTPDLDGKFTIQTDASGYGLGAVLLAEHDGKNMPVSFISRNLKAAEKNYSVTEQECLAVVWACEKFRPFVECTKFTVQTDHKALTWLMDMKDPKGRLARWVLRLQGYDFVIDYRPGAINHVPDTLSRNPIIKDDSDFLPEVFNIGEDEEIQLHKIPLFVEFSRENLISAQQEDTLLKEVAEYIRTDQVNPVLSNADKLQVLAMGKDAFILDDGLMVRYNNPFLHPSFLDELNYERILIPAKLRNLVMQKLHDDATSGHLGIDQTHDLIQKRFYWPNLYKSVQKYVTSCHTCQTCKISNEKPFGLMKAKIQSLPWQKVACDLIGPFPRSKNGNTMALVIIDTCTGWPEVFPLRGTIIGAEQCANKALATFCRWGFPSIMVSDSGPQFACKLWIETMKLLKIAPVFTTPYHPQANPTERRNRDVKSYLQKYLTSRHIVWDEHIFPMLFALRNARIKSTGLTPFEANFGRPMKAPIDVFKPDPTYSIDFGESIHDYVDRTRHRIKCAMNYLAENRELASLEQKLYYDPNHKHNEFEIGDYVTIEAHPLSNSAKKFSAGLAPKREGPYIIIRKESPLNYVLGDVHTNEPRTFAHIVQMKKYVMRENIPVLTGGTVPGTVDRTKPKGRPAAAYGLGKSRGRPVGSTAQPAIVTTPLGRTDRVTRSQTLADQATLDAQDDIRAGDTVADA